MEMRREGLTPYAEINALLDQLLARMRAVLGEKLVGLYLFGSLAEGDFDYVSSDVDFAAATLVKLDEGELAQLKTMHAEIAAHGGRWGKTLNGAYIALAALRRYEPAQRHPYCSSTTPLGVTALGHDWVLIRHVLREKGIVVYGSPLASLIDPISCEELLVAVRTALRENWTPYLDGPEVIRPRYFQAFAVLTMCRALRALATGELVSKPAAATWALGHLDVEWAPLIQRALAWRADKTADDAALPETLRFLRFAISQG